MVKLLKVQSAFGDYEVQIQSGLFTELGTNLQKQKISQIFILTDQHVYQLYSQKLKEILEESKIKYQISVVEPGEPSKSLQTAETIFEKILAFSMDRHTPLLAFGGGMVSDLGGYCASLYFRGIPLILVPTTLLAQVDACLGGKVAINFQGTKNLLGHFYPPKQIIIDPDFLKTLPPQEIRSGFGEVIKYGMIGNFRLLKQLSVQKSTTLEQLEDLEISELIAKCLFSKKQIVEQDENDKGRRAILNFGHTLGHALESSKEWTMSHGEAVALGMLAITHFAKAQNILLEEEVLEVLTCCLNNFGFQQKVIVSGEEFLKYLVRDKKKEGNNLNLILPFAKGKVRMNHTFNANNLHQWLLSNPGVITLS